MNASLQVINPHAAGLDVGSEKIHASVAGDRPQVFGTCLSDLHALRDWLQKEKVEAVAMEATGVYWLCVYEVLEAAGFKLIVVNGRHVKNLPGRKTDMSDCQWIATLHAHGLLRGGFVPNETVRRLRDYQRLRQDLITMASAHVQHMQKALERLGLKIHDVISSLTGVSGLRMVRAIVEEGARDPEALADLCDAQILKHKRKDLIKALQGQWRAEHLFALKQALQCWDFYQQRLAECDQQIAAELKNFSTQSGEPSGPGPKAARKELRHNAPQNMTDLPQWLYRIFGGKDVASLPAFNDYTALQLLSEIGSDLSAWPTRKHFTSWLGLAPGSKQSGKRRQNAVRHGGPAGQIFKLCARAMSRAKNSWIGSFYRRLSALKGPKIANKATARKLAELYYDLLTKGITYVEQGIARYEEKYRAQQMRLLRLQAKKLGMYVLPKTSGLEVHG